MTDPDLISALLEKFNGAYDGDLDEQLGATWRDELKPLLLHAWCDGFTTGFADREGPWRDRRSRT